MAEEPITMRLSGDILFFHILPRLPAKSLGRFTCVSKQWLSFIRTPGFIKLHRHRVINYDHQKLLFLPNNRPWEFHTIDCETPKDGLTASRPLPFKVRSSPQEIWIVTSLHGTVCVGWSRLGNSFEYSDLILWNPVTGDYKTLSKAGSHVVCYQIYGNKFGLLPTYGIHLWGVTVFVVIASVKISYELFSDTRVFVGKVVGKRICRRILSSVIPAFPSSEQPVCLSQ